MNRSRASLVLLLLFVACTGVAIVVSGYRPALQQGIAPAAAQFAGYLFALGAAALLLTGPRGGASGTRRTGAMVLGAVAGLVLVDLLVRDEAGGNIGVGLVRVVGLVVLMVATIRLARAAAAAGRTG